MYSNYAINHDNCFFLAKGLLTEHAANGLVEAPLKQVQRMKDLLLCVHVVVKTLNLQISRCRSLVDYVKECY